jgi:hypothetical protein
MWFCKHLCGEEPSQFDSEDRQEANNAQSRVKNHVCLSVAIAIKQERASVREEEALVESWSCHAQGPKRIPFYHFSPQITFFAVAAADCLLDREESSEKRMKKDLPQSPKSKSRKSQAKVNWHLLFPYLWAPSAECV